MRLLDYTLDLPAANLALDEALLDHLDENPEAEEVLRLWEPSTPMVVIGRSSKINDEVNRSFTKSNCIPVLRRSSGGAAIVTGPGCFMYAVVIRSQRRGSFHPVDEIHERVLRRTAQALQSIGLDVARQGTSDLTLGNQKFSGNSLRCKRDAVLYHGTLLYDFDLSLIAKCLDIAPRQPAYRNNRPHENFVTNLPTTSALIRQALVTTWQATKCDQVPQDAVDELVQVRYGKSSWHERR